MNTKPTILLLYFILLFHLCHSQNISGRWIGGHSTSNKIILDLVQVKDSVTGIGYVEFNDKIGRANVAVEGVFNTGVFEYVTKKILEQDIDTNYLLCFVAGKEFLKIKKNKHILEGACISVDKKEECFNLSALEKYVKKVDFTFRKKDFIGRRVLVVDTIIATQDSLELLIWDNMKEDGDIVSVYLNEEKLISGYLLRNQPKSIKIICDKKINEVLFYAHNLGSEPPNTATISVKQDGKILKTIDIKSDANKNESFVIMRK